MTAPTRMRWISRIAIVLAIVLATLSVVGGVMLAAGVHRLTRVLDYSELPPERAFERVFRRPPPPGVTAIRAAGYEAFSGVWIDVRVEADDRAIDNLLRGARADPYQSFPDCSDQYGVASGCDDVAHTATPQYYIFPREEGGDLWEREVVVDRKRHLLFGHGFRT